jgi:hypothetical protein
MKHFLFEELEAFNPHWQRDYSSVRAAAEAANVMPEYYDWLTSNDGKRYKATMRDVPDTLAAVKKLQELEANSALPHKRANIGKLTGYSNDY